MNRKMLAFAILLVVSAAMIMCLPLLSVSAQTTTVIKSLSPEKEGPAGQQFNITVAGTISTPNGEFLVVLRDALAVDIVQVNGTIAGNDVIATLPIPALQPGNYNVTLRDVTTSEESFQNFHLAAEGIAAIPTAALMIMLIAVAISFANMLLNRALITKLIGWHEYRSMQKEISEYNSQRMAALRAKDEKTLEKLKKKDSQIQAMQTKMMKPNLLLLPITFIYIIIWPLLIGFFPFFVAYLPGFGAVPFFYWYLICSFFFGTLISKIIGVTPIQ